MLVPAFDESFSVPLLGDTTPENVAQKVQVYAHIPQVIEDGARIGEQYGTIEYSLEGKTLRTIPLVAATDVKEAGAVRRAYGHLVASITRRFLKARAD